MLFLLLPGAAITRAEPRFVPGRILIKPKDGIPEARLQTRLQEHGAEHRRLFRRLNIRLLAVPEERAGTVLAALRRDPDIEFAERDYLAQAAFLPNDPYVASGDAWHLASIEAALAWNFTAGRGDVVVAVLDSGVNAAHPDLAAQVLPGFDLVNNDADPADDFGHGTAVTGTLIAAGNNGYGVAGVAFGARVLPVKVMDASGFAAYSCIAQGVRYAVDQGARIINISIAGDSPSATLQDAINYAWSNNVVVIAAAGNNGNDAVQYPAGCEHVAAVSATEPDESLAWFSSRGSRIALAAPGDNIWTTQRDLQNPYAAWRGTSFASPIAAGVAALVASENPSLSNAQIVALLEQTAEDSGSPGYDNDFGHGRVDAGRAVTAASLEPGARPPAPPPGPGTTNQPPVSAADTNPPSATITQSPPDGARLAVSELVVAGTAGDDAGVEEVQVTVNGATSLADGATNWTARTVLSPGANIITVRSLDLAGNRSAPVSRTFTRVVLAPLAVRTNGPGKVAPHLDGRLLEIGRGYAVKAVPGPGQAFAGWDGVPSASPALNFIMQSNLVLVANFVPSPFPPVKGSYAGLIANADGVLPDNSGYFTLAVTKSGRFTGKLRIGGRSHGFHGALDLAGHAVVPVRRGQLRPLTLALQVDLTNGTDQVAGRVTDGGWISEAAGDRRVFSAKLNPAPQAGSRSFILQRADGDAGTAATGSSTISAGGVARVKGRLGDGRSFSASSPLARNGDCPFYLSYQRGTEVVIGWLNFPSLPAPGASGTVLWVRTGTNAFAATLKAASAP